MLDTYGVDGVVRWLERTGILSENLLSVHTVHADPDEVALLAERAVSVSHNPFSNLYCGAGVAPVGHMVSLGIKVGLGTDGAANNNGQDIFDAQRITRLLGRSRAQPFDLGPMEGLRMATMGGAEALGLDHLIGSIEPGKYADIVILDTRRPHLVPLQRPAAHVAHFAKGSDVDAVIIGGRMVVKPGRTPVFDHVKVAAEADEAGRALVARLA